MTLQPDVLYQHRDKRPFRLVGCPPCYLGITTDGVYFCQDMTGERTPLRYARGAHLCESSIPLIPNDQRLPQGF